MSVNRYQPHVLVLPEDDANRQIANGFLLASALRARSIQVLPEAGGWLKVLESFEADEISGMNQYPNRFLILLIDLDGRTERVQEARQKIPAQLSDRVFILSTLTEPERLKAESAHSYEEIGMAMAKDCVDGTDTIWDHELLRHNAGELGRMREQVRPFLFGLPA